MLPDTDAIFARFYALFKVHKPYEQGTAPDLRPIVSCSGTMMENIGIFVEHYILWNITCIIFTRYTRFFKIHRQN